MSHPPPAPPASSPKAKTWTAGTLTYTSGGLIVLFAWLLFGDFSWSMRDRSVGPMANWYLKELGVSDFLFALLLSSFPAALGLFLGPIISMKSDRHRGPRGRRIPFLLITTPIAAFGMLGIAATPHIARWVHSFFPERSETLIAVVCFGVFWAAFEFATIAATAVFGGLINDVVPKSLLGRFHGLFRAVSLLDGIVFNYWIMGKVPEHFSLILGVIGVFYGLAFLWMCYRVKEGEYPPPPPAVEGRFPALTATKSYFRECFGNTYYLSIFAMLTLGMMSFMPVNIFAIPFARSVEMNMDYYGKCLAITFTISLCLSYFLGWLADVFHPIRVSMLALLAYAGVMVWSWFGVHDADSFARAFILHAVISGTYMTFAASLGQRLFPHFRYAQFASAAGVCLSVLSLGFAPAVGLLIDRSGSDYRLTFVLGAVLSLLALASALTAYRRFKKLGGVKNYTPPE